MADPDQEAELLDGTVSQTLSDDTCIVDTTHVQTDHDGMSEELLRQALADANAFDSSGITYIVPSDETEVCDTGQVSSCVNSGLDATTNHDVTVTHHIPHSTENVMVQSTESILAGTSEAIFSNGTDALLTNETHEVLGVEANGTYTVDVGSLPEGQIISIPNDMLPGSVIISQGNEEQFQQHVVEGNEDTQLLSDDTQQYVQQIDSQYVQQGDGELLEQETTSQIVENESFTQPQAITVSAPSGLTMSPEMLQSVIQQVQAQQLAQQQAAAAHKKQTTAAGSSAPSNTVSFTVVSPSQHNSSSPPLGSSQNPIRIIQQGNRYTPMQQLTREQLQQIMQVVQQQHVNKNTQENGGAVIFNPQTNTRIMYRVIYPSELHKTQSATGQTTYQVVRPSTSSQEQQTGTPHQKRPYKKRKEAATTSTGAVEDEEKEKSTPDAPEMSKEEKEERKKHRPRTRSGRVSKPPKHMVQDYKHIHVLDWDEDYDDSDGGYSDFKHSDEEGKIKQEGEEEHSASPEFFQALGAGRPKNHKCQTCDKSYIGQAGLARHYRLNPDHCIHPTENGSISSLHNGSIDGEDSKDASLLQDGGSSRMSDSTAELAKVINHSGSNNIENFSEDSNTQDSLNSTGATSPVVRRGRGRGGYRGRWAHLKHNALVRRKNKLKELMKQCTDEDLMEVVLPRLVNSISVWEYLMMKSEKGGTRPQVDVIYHEFEALRQHVKQACADYMQPLTQEELEDDNLQCKMIKVSDKSLAVCLNMEPVTYRVKEMPPGDSNSFSSLHNKLSAAAIINSVGVKSASDDKLKALDIDAETSAITSNAAGVKRPIKLISHDQSEEPHLKKAHISTIASPVTLNHLPTTPSSSSTSSHSFAGTVNLQPSVEEKISYARSDSSLSSISSLSASSATSPQSQAAAVHGQSQSSISTLAITSSISSFASSSKFTSSSTSVRSPYIHISCPSTKQQSVSYILAGPKKPGTSPGKGSSKTQPVPVIINQSAGSTAQVLPYIVSQASTAGAGLQQKLLVAAPGSQAIQSGTVPIVLAAPGNQQTGNTTVLLTSGTAAGAHRVIVRQPPQTVPQTSQVILPNPSLSTKSQKLAGTSAFSTAATVSTIQASSLPASSSRSLLGMIKPTEVKVSRQLFHDATSSSASSSISNGRSNGKASGAAHINPAFQQGLSANAIVSSSNSPPSLIGNGTSNSIAQTAAKSFNNKTLVTPPSGQQYITSPSKAIISVAEGDVDDISVLSAMEFSGDDLGPLNASSDSLNCSLSTSTNLADSIVTDMAATSSVSDTVSLSQSQAAVGATSLVASADMVHAVTADSHTFDNIHNGHPHGISLINGSSSDFSTDISLSSSSSSTVKVKDHSIITQASSLPSSTSSSSSSSLNLAGPSDFINLPLKSSPPFITSVTKDSSIAQSSTYHIGTNGALSSQVVKSDLTSSSSIMMADIPGLSFGDQGTTHISDTTSGHLNGISPILSSDYPQENSVGLLSDSDQISGAETEIDNQILDSGDAGLSDALQSTDEGQLLLSEGTNIYQTEDGTLIIQSANGNTYQLQGAQNLPLETVQALLSGTFDQLGGAEGLSDSIQTDVQLH